MSETESQLPSQQTQQPQGTDEQPQVTERPHVIEQPNPQRKLRRFFLRHIPLAIGSILVLLVLLITGVYLLMSSARFETMVRQRLIAELQQATGGRVEIAAFHWKLLQLQAEADGVVIHGREMQSEMPLAQVDRLRARVSLLGLWSPSVRLRELDIAHPVFHLVVYEDGSTNLPKPKRPANQSQRPIDTFFDLKAGHISLEQGYFEFESRASSFDAQNRNAPLNLQADDVSVQLRYLAGSIRVPEAYRIDAGAADLNLTRTVVSDQARQKPKPVHGYFQATLDLTRNSATLQSLRLTARDSAKISHSLNVSGTLQDFTNPRWQAKVFGDLDMRLLDPITGYPFAPEGLAHLDLNASGQGDKFTSEGKIHIDGGAYIGPGASVSGVRVDANVHADNQRLLISSIVARLRQGGQVSGTVDLSPWIAKSVESISQALVTASGKGGRKKRNETPITPGTLPMNGKVKADFKDVSLDTILDIVSVPPFQRLGIGSTIDGQAAATWVNGEDNSVTVATNLNLRPASHLLAGEVAGSGILDATYTQRNGAVDVRTLELHLPASDLSVSGALGAYPISSASALTVDFHTSDLGEFDTVLHSLGVQRNGKSGTAALPVSIGGQADFHGSWAGSIVNPRLSGNLSATQLDLEMPAMAFDTDALSASTRTVHLDSVEATGSYSATRITVEHGVLQRGDAKLAISGVLTAATTIAPTGKASGSARQTGGVPASGVPAFDRNAVLNLRIDAAKINAADLQQFVKQKLPFTGVLDTQLQVDGPLSSPVGSGWVQLDSGSVYGEPVDRVRADGKMAEKVINLSSISIASSAGTISAMGTYDLQSKRFQMDAKSSAIDVAKIDSISRQNWGASGKLTFNVHGTGTFDDPQLQGDATLANLAFGGEPVGALQMNAHTVNHALVYDLTTRLDTATLNLHGETTFKPDYQTQARIEFSQFNIDSILRLAHVKQLSGESALAGTIAIEGPLAHLERLRGEARLQEVEATVAGVHLKSVGEVHATLANERIQLDPLHVTGEDTDLRGQGTLALSGARQLDVAVNGSVNLKLAQTVDPDLTASGNTTFQVEAHGPLKNPSLQGRIDIDNGAVSFGDLPNGLSQLRGRLEFNQDRLEVRTLTAMSGGGPLSVGGYLSYQRGVYADLSVTAKGVRIRYPQGISSLADATLHLQGSQSSMLLSGDVLITRFSVSQDMDFAALASQAKSAQGVVPANSPTNHVRLDVRIHSSPQLNFQNAFAKLAGDVDIRLRGTLATPSLLGRVSVTEGNAIIAGTRYELQRGDVTFTNPVRIEPIIDLSANARVQDYDITLALNGTLDKLSVTYRSDPPMPESDVVALLALGRTGNEQRLYTQQQERALSNPTTDALLGGALNATVSSRVQKLFGAGSVKVDPNYLGSFGNSTSRIIVEEQLGRNVTLTYATDVNTTGRQLLQAEIAVNRHVSLLVARDEAGVFSMVVKATRRYR
jgi:translocation and assembly module TamB